jgi:hypothetical protein
MRARSAIGGSGRGWQPKPGVSFSHADYTRCLVTQGFYVRASRLAHMLRAVHAHLQVYPVWTCPVRVMPAVRADRLDHTQTGMGSSASTSQSAGRLWQGLVGDGPHWAFDVGTYGVPSAPGYRAFATVRALQRECDSPTQWGLSYLTRQEMTNPDGWINARAYADVRAAYAAEGAFPALHDKFRPYDPAVDGEGGGVIACWRLKRDGIFGLATCAACTGMLVGAAYAYAILQAA